MNLYDLNTLLREYFLQHPRLRQITKTEIIQLCNLNRKDKSDAFLIQNLHMIESIEPVTSSVFKIRHIDQYKDRPNVRIASSDKEYNSNVGHTPSDILRLKITPKPIMLPVSNKNKLVMIKGNDGVCQYCFHFNIDTSFCKYRRISMQPHSPACMLCNKI